MAEDKKIIAENRKARFDYFIEESYECGIELQGTEVKSVKAGAVSFPDAFAEIVNGEIFIKNFHISEYSSMRDNALCLRHCQDIRSIPISVFARAQAIRSLPVLP